MKAYRLNEEEAVIAARFLSSCLECNRESAAECDWRQVEGRTVRTCAAQREWLEAHEEKR